MGNLLGATGSHSISEKGEERERERESLRLSGWGKSEYGKGSWGSESILHSTVNATKGTKRNTL